MNDKTSNKPLNCPLCGSLSGLCITDTREYIRAYTGKIQCSECDLMLQMTSDDVSELRTSLIKAWNTRKPMERILERLEEEPYINKGGELFLNGDNEDCLPLRKVFEIVKEEGGIRNE